MDPGGPLELNPFYKAIYLSVDAILPSWVAYFLAGFIVMFVIVNGMMVLATLYIWLERRLLGRFQVRLGPNRWGPFGLLQPIADALKILTKEDIVPRGADRWIFNFAPVIFFVPIPLIVAVVPIGKDIYITNLNIGLLYLVAVTGFGTLGIFMAGWASNNRYSLFGAARAVAMLISYEIPLVVTLAVVAVLAGSLSLNQIVYSQDVPYLLVQPLAFIVFFLAALAEMNRSPFDIVEAESELVAGYHTEYSGMKFGMFMLAEFASVPVMSAVAATLFLQGWRWPLLPPMVWFLFKMGIFVFLFVWLRATLPRMRVDQIMAFAWKFLLPLSLIALFATAIEVYFLRGPDGTLSSSTLWTMVPINIVVTVVSLVVMANVLGQRRMNISKRNPFAYAKEQLKPQAMEIK